MRYTIWKTGISVVFIVDMSEFQSNGPSQEDDNREGLGRFRFTVLEIIAAQVLVLAYKGTSVF